ncbi:MAG TPA: daunorubicin resistance protein DrrC, partial [Saprospirales bacterium]|nr:daunorubicin resistance protein DrrC [Saprospirales bacterium]
MEKDLIIVKNAHTNNLKNINIEIPKHRFVVFTGVSGSGKSSLLFDTIYTEAQRQLIETFSTFARTRMPKLSRPEVDDILHLSTAIVIDQKRMGTNLRSTVGTATELNTYLRLLYSRLAKPFIGPSFYFSFNHPEGMCADCKGLGKQIRIDLDMFLDKSKSLREGAITHPFYAVGNLMWKELIQSGIFEPDKKLQDFTAEEMQKLLFSEPFAIKDAKEKLAYNRNFEGIVRKLENSVQNKAEDENPGESKNAYSKFFLYKICESCNGTRLNKRAEEPKIMNTSLGELCRMELTSVHHLLSQLDNDISRPIIRKVNFLLEQLIEIGAGYLSLERPVSSLSGGESQRVKMARQLDCNLVDLLYVLDEPSIGLHPRDTEKLLGLLNRLKARGNSVFVVEHDPDIISAADWIVDLGPKAGYAGGQVIYNGPGADFIHSESLTSKFLFAPKRPMSQRKKPDGFYKIQGAGINNLKNIEVSLPKGVLTCVTGVAGSGKSSLIHGCFAKQHPEAIVIDQQPIGKSSRANPATFIGAFDLIRKEFAAQTGADASLFSFNSKGACPKCNGQGSLSFEMFFLDAVKTICDGCDGKRYHEEVLELKMNGRNIADVLNMTAEESLHFFESNKIKKLLLSLKEVGLGYLKLGQSLSSLSGGEAQRLKIAAELHKESNIYIMDEPTTGLHLSDIDNFYRIVRSLVDHNNTVVIIEHNLDIISHADWVIDMGPEGGRYGGEILFEGTPDELVHCESSFTGKCLKAYFNPTCKYF